LFAPKFFFSPPTALPELLMCSREAQLPCRSMTGSQAADTSDAEADDIDALGMGFGGEVDEIEALSRGRAPFAAVGLSGICSEAFLLTVGFGGSFRLFLDIGLEVSEVDFSSGGFFCFSKCSAMASTSASVESNCVLSS
jgi:hypothetical protein